jgi:hypothetical protein
MPRVKRSIVINIVPINSPTSAPQIFGVLKIVRIFSSGSPFLAKKFAKIHLLFLFSFIFTSAISVTIVSGSVTVTISSTTVTSGFVLVFFGFSVDFLAFLDLLVAIYLLK